MQKKQGALIAEIDEKKGVLGEAISFSPFMRRSLRHY